MALLRSAPLAPPLLMEIDGEGRNEIEKGMAEAFRRLEAA
jgi:hypothetical protein